MKSNILSMDSIFTFGKYEGEQVEDVLEEDPSYIKYMAEEGLNFDEEVLELVARI